jgi:hypothetical protein
MLGCFMPRNASGPAATSTEIETAGNTKLAQVADMYFVYTGDGSSGVILRQWDSYFVAGGMLGVETRTDGDYDAMMKVGSNQYQLWQFRANGDFLSRPFNQSFSGSSFQMQDAEIRFHQDFNGNGVIGTAAFAAPAGDVGFASTQTIEAAGVTALRQIDNTYFMDPVGGGSGSGPQIRLNGSPWMVGQNGSWRAIGAEQMSNGYSVWWQYGLADQFVQWTTDLAGNWVSNGPFLTHSRYALQADETTFQQDLNGDGTIGVVSSEIETVGNTKLAQVADMYFMYQGNGSSGVLLRKDGAPWTVGQDGPWRVIGAEQTASGYSVWLRAGTGNFYQQWNTDFAGNYVSTAANTNGGSYALQSTESTFQQDLNGDGTIGLTSSSIETVGNTKLAQVADMYFMYQGDGSSGVLVRYHGLASNPGGQWLPIGAEQTANGYSVWLSGAGQFVEWNTDSNGNFVSYGSLIVGSKGYALESSEPTFQQDFNGDGTLGVVSSSIETAGNTKLAQVADMYFAYTGDGSSGVILRDNNNNSTYLAAGMTQRVLGVETRTDGDYDAMMQVTSDGYEVWQFRANGDWLRRPFPFHPFSASSFQMQDAENRFQQDFNGNGVIGSSVQMMSSSGSSGATADPALLLNYMASAFATPAGEGTGVVAGAQTSGQEFLTKPLA